jgi:gas vesicle protein
LIEPDTTMEPGKVNGALVGAKQALAAAPKDADPQLLGLLKQRVDFLQKTHDQNMDDQKTIAGQKAGAAQNATQPTKDVEIGKADLQKIWSGEKGYASALQQGKQTIDSIKAGADGNGLLTSMASTMEVLGVNRAAGVTRISPAEAAAANLPGGYAERFNAWADKAASGKLSPQLASEGKQLMNIVLDSAHAKAIQEAKFTAANRGIPEKNAVALDRSGKLTTLDKLSTSPVYQTNPQTGQRRVSYDGKKTWQIVQQ